jgi:hypothetical protein
MKPVPYALLAAGLALGGCGERQDAQSDSVPGMGAMRGMGEMRMRADSLMPMMRAHLDSLVRMRGRTAPAMLRVHDAMAAQLLDAMGADMMAMGMHGDTTWAALTDSIRRDLADLPGLSGRPLETRLRAHIERMRRLMTMHEGMMQGMMPR